MEKEIPYNLGDERIVVQLSTHADFVKCISDEPSPFKHSTSAIAIAFDISQHEKAVVKCFMEESERKKLVNKKVSAQQIFHEIIQDFLIEVWPNHQLEQIESYHCNHFEEQYKYILIKKEAAES